MQPVLSEDTVINIQDNSGQIAIGNYIVQIGSIHGGVVNVAMPEQQPRPRLRPTPVLLRPRPFLELLDRKPETSTATTALPAYQPVEFYGQAGMGKTSLLRYLAYQLPLNTWPDGVIYLSARQQPVADLLQFIFEAFYESDLPFKPTEAQLRHALQTKQALILLDEVNLGRTELELLMDAAPSCAFLLTSSERQLWGEGQVRTLQGLPLDDALALFKRELDRSLTPEEEQVAPILCSALEGHPLHLLQVAAIIRDKQCALPELVHHLQQDKADKALAGRIIASLSGPERQVMGLLAATNGAPLHEEHLIALTGRSDLASLLESLLERKLIQAHSPRYSLTGTLDQRWSQIWDLSPVREEILVYLIRWAEQRQQLPDRLLEEMAALRQSLTWAVNSGRSQEALLLGRAIEEVLSLSGRWGAWGLVLRDALQAAEAVGNEGAEAWVWHQLGTRALCLEDFEAARIALNRALQLREMLGDWAGAAITRHNLNLLVPPPPAGGQKPTNTPPSSPETGSPPVSSPSLLQLSLSAIAMSGLLALFMLLAGIAGMQYLPFIWPSPTEPSPVSIVSLPFATITPTFTPTFTPSPTSPSSPTSTLPATFPTPTHTATNTPTPTPTATNMPTSTPAATGTPTPSPSPTRTPTRSRPEIFSVSPASGEVGANVVILVRGQNFRPNEAGFRVELIGDGGSNILSVSGLGSDSAFEAILPSNLSVGSYDLIVVNPDSEMAIRSAAYEVTNRRVTVTPQPLISITPDRLSFGEQFINTPGESQIITLVNLGPTVVTLTQFGLTGEAPDDFSVDHNCPSGLSFNERCNVTVQFRPATVGARNTNLAIFSNVVGSPHQILLQGMGVVGQADLIVSQLEQTDGIDFGPNNELIVPIRAVVNNQGNAPAPVFKVATSYAGGSFGPFVASFRANSTEDVDPDNGFYPFTRREIAPNGEVAFEGVVIFTAIENQNSLSLRIMADSCSGEEFALETCRVEEANEDNNESQPILVDVPRPDLVVSLLEQSGPIDFGPKNEILVPVRVAVRNQGNAPADVFKIAAVYVGGNLGSDSPRLATFLGQGTDRVTITNGFGYTRDKLLPQETLIFDTITVFDAREQGATVALSTIADSCIGDAGLPDACRIGESNENNNEAIPISLQLFSRID